MTCYNLFFFSVGCNFSIWPLILILDIFFSIFFFYYIVIEFDHIFLQCSIIEMVTIFLGKKKINLNQLTVHANMLTFQVSPAAEVRPNVEQVAAFALK